MQLRANPNDAHALCRHHSPAREALPQTHAVRVEVDEVIGDFGLEFAEAVSEEFVANFGGNCGHWGVQEGAKLGKEGMLGLCGAAGAGLGFREIVGFDEETGGGVQHAVGKLENFENKK